MYVADTCTGLPGKKETSKEIIIVYQIREPDKLAYHNNKLNVRHY